MKRKVKYSEGTWFAIPLREGGFALGLVARATPKGPQILAYLFGPKRDGMPTLAQTADLRASSAVKVLRAGDLHLLDGRWKVLGESSDFRREEWPFPRFVRNEEIGRRSWVVEYAEDDPGRVVAEVPVEFGSSTLERDSLYGAGAVEIVLTRLLGGS